MNRKITDKVSTSILFFVFIVLLATYSFSKDGVVTLHGAIEDSQCAFNVHSEGHSHEWMEKKHVAGARTDKSCTLLCVREMGGKFVLVVKDEVYRLEDQTLSEKFAGEKVKVTGTLDAKTQTLHNMRIEKE